MRIETKQQLMEILNKNEKIEIVGTGWIAKLMFYYLKIVLDIKETDIVVIKENKIANLDWNIPLLDEVLLSGRIIIVAEKEDKGDIISKSISGVSFFISENLKNEIDAELMEQAPEIYEREVLNGRKKELDGEMSERISLAISDIYSQKQFPIFQGIEIETINRCNGSCSFCPINKFEDNRKLKYMESELFYSIIDQLGLVNYQGRIALFSNNEPFLDNRMNDFIVYSKKKVTGAFIYLFTNGTLITLEEFKKTIEYLDFICIDLYFDNKDEIASFEMKKILKYCIDENLCEKVMVQIINRSAIRNNRGGNSKNRHAIYEPKAPCILPFTQMIVRPDGKLSLCCNDPFGNYTMGDLTKETLIEAWNNTNYHDMRLSIRKSRANVPYMCKRCDNYSTTNQNGNLIFTKKQISDSWERVNTFLIN